MRGACRYELSGWKLIASVASFVERKLCVFPLQECTRTCLSMSCYVQHTNSYVHNTSTSLSERVYFMIVSRSANTVAFECILVGCGQYSVFNKNRKYRTRFWADLSETGAYSDSHTQRKSHAFLMKFWQVVRKTYMKIMPVVLFLLFFCFSHFLTNNPNLANPSSGICLLYTSDAADE